MKDFIEEKVTREAKAAAELIREINSDDEQLNHDMVEGETNFFEAVECVLDEIRMCDTLQHGIEQTSKQLADRKDRVKKRAERLRGLIDQAFQMAEIKSHTFPCETVTIKRTPPKLIITDESQIPSQFFVPQPPKLDKKALLAAAKEASVKGAEMSNGGQTIQIRRA